MKLVFVVIFAYVVVYAFFPTWYDYFLPIPQLDNPTIKYIGLAFLFFSFVWIVIAQKRMPYETTTKMPNAQQAVWHNCWCNSAERFVEI